LAIFFSILCAVVYGASDFCGGLASRRTATLGVVVVSQGVGFVLLLAFAPLFGGTPVASDWFWGAMCGIATGAALVLLYRGLAIGTMGVVSPITAVLAAAVPIAYGVILRGERPATTAIAGIALALLAVVCVSASPSEADARTGDVPARTALLPPGVIEAIGAGVCFGTIFITLAQTHAAAGMYPLLVARLTTFGSFAFGGALAGKIADVRVPRSALALVALCGALDVSANVFYVIAVHTGLISVVAVISSLYPASTVALAAIVVRERLAPIQWAGVGMAFAGVTAISLSR
jgi:drug/metabolite transporter (DMT)-like permease